MVLLALALCLLGACLAAFKASLLKIRYIAIDSKKREQIATHKYMAEILDKADLIGQIIKFSYIGVTLALGMLVYPLLANILFLENYLLFAVFVSFILILALQYFLYDLASRAVISVSPQKGIQMVAFPILILTKILAPCLWIIRFLSKKILLRFKMDFEEEIDPLDATIQIKALGDPAASFSPQLIAILRNTIRLPELDVTDVLLPRNQVQYLDLNDSVQDNLYKARTRGHTRFPLCEGGLDKCFGIIHIKDIFQFQGNLETLDFLKFQRPLIRLAENTPLEEALRKLLRFKIHMALVVDEFGSTIGLITLEDILEELVGNIQDEFDQEEATIIPLGKNIYKVSGLAPIHELESVLDIKVENQDVATLGGLVTATLGRIPEVLQSENQDKRYKNGKKKIIFQKKNIG